MKPAVFAIARLLLLCLAARLACAQTGPSLIAPDSAVVEGNSGNTNLVFHLTLSQSSDKTVMVDYATRDRTAHRDSDYWETFGVAIFPPGATNFDVAVIVKGDELNEADETFWLMLAHPVNARLLQNHAVGTILNDDPVPTLAINDVALAERGDETTNATFRVRLSNVSDRTITVDCVTANGSAMAGEEFIPVAETLTFVPGATDQTLAVPVNGGALTRSEETFSVILTNPVNATIGRVLGTATVMSERPAVALSKPPDASLRLAQTENAPRTRAPLAPAPFEPETVPRAAVNNLPAASEPLRAASAIEPLSATGTATDGLSLEVSGIPKWVHVERILVVTLVVTNSAPTAAQQVVVTNWLPRSATFLSAEVGQGSYSHSRGTVVFSLGELPGNSSAAAAMALKFSAPGPATNVVRIASGTGDPVSIGQLNSQVVVALNDRPLLSPIPDQATPQNTPTPPIPFMASDSETPAAALIVLASSSNTQLVPDDNLFFGGTPIHRTLTVVPAAGQIGTADITMTVTDSAGAEASQTFAVTVSPRSSETLSIELVGSPPPAPAFDRVGCAGDLMNLYFNAAQGLAYTVEFSDSLEAGSWRTLTAVEASPAPESFVVSDPIADHSQRFYRLSATAPAGFSPRPDRVELRFTAGAGRSYTLEYCDSLSQGSWQALTNVGPFDALSEVSLSDPVAPQPQRFYRLRSH